MKNLTINVGDYVRSYDGHIARCKRFYSYDNFIHFDRDIIDTCCEPTNYFDKKDIKKYIKVVSPNIIDLIEEKDIITYEYETSIGKIIEYNVTVLLSLLNELEENPNKYKIKSIVTKEQMESMEYKI